MKNVGKPQGLHPNLRMLAGGLGRAQGPLQSAGNAISTDCRPNNRC